MIHLQSYLVLYRVWPKQHNRIQVFSAIFHSGGPGKTHLRQNRVFHVLGHVLPIHNCTLAERWTGGETGRSDINTSVLLQRKLRCEKFSDELWSQQMAGSTRTGQKKGRSFYASQVFLLHMSGLHWGLQIGDCKTAATKSHNGTPQNSWSFLGFINMYMHYMLGLLSAS